MVGANRKELGLGPWRRRFRRLGVVHAMGGVISVAA